MKTIKLSNGDTFEPLEGRNIDRFPEALARCNGSTYIPSEFGIRKMGVDNYGTNPQIADNWQDSSTLSATRGVAQKVIISYDNSGSNILTAPARFGLELISAKRLRDANERLVNNGINLDIEGRWDRYEQWTEKDGVYTRNREDWFVKGENGELIGLNADMSEQQAHECPLILTKAGCPDFVDERFWLYKGEKQKSIDDVHGIIEGTFKLGKDNHGFETMMGQYLPDVDEKGVMKAWLAGRLINFARSNARADLDNDYYGRVPLCSVGDAVVDESPVDRVYSTFREQISSASEPVVRKALEDMFASGELKLNPRE